MIKEMIEKAIEYILCKYGAECMIALLVIVIFLACILVVTIYDPEEEKKKRNHQKFIDWWNETN